MCTARSGASASLGPWPDAGAFEVMELSREANAPLNTGNPGPPRGLPPPPVSCNQYHKEVLRPRKKSRTFKRFLRLSDHPLIRITLVLSLAEAPTPHPIRVVILALTAATGARSSRLRTRPAPDAGPGRAFRMERCGALSPRQHLFSLAQRLSRQNELPASINLYHYILSTD